MHVFNFTILLILSISNQFLALQAPNFDKELQQVKGLFDTLKNNSNIDEFKKDAQILIEQLAELEKNSKSDSVIDAIGDIKKELELLSKNKHNKNQQVDINGAINEEAMKIQQKLVEQQLLKWFNRVRKQSQTLTEEGEEELIKEIQEMKNMINDSNNGLSKELQKQLHDIVNVFEKLDLQNNIKLTQEQEQEMMKLIIKNLVESQPIPTSKLSEFALKTERQRNQEEKNSGKNFFGFTFTLLVIVCLGYFIIRFCYRRYKLKERRSNYDQSSYDNYTNNQSSVSINV